MPDCSGGGLAAGCLTDHWPNTHALYAACCSAPIACPPLTGAGRRVGRGRRECHGAPPAAQVHGPPGMVHGAGRLGRAERFGRLHPLGCSAETDLTLTTLCVPPSRTAPPHLFLPPSPAPWPHTGQGVPEAGCQGPGVPARWRRHGAGGGRRCSGAGGRRDGAAAGAAAARG